MVCTILAVAFTSCKKDTTVRIVEITLNQTSLLLDLGASETLTAIVKPDNATNKEVMWNSSDASIISVDASGKITALKMGTATITVTTTDGDKTANCEVTVVTALEVTVTGIYQYKGVAHEPSGDNVTVIADNAVLTANVDYTLSYGTNTNAGTATVKAIGKGIYTESMGTGNFTIDKCPIAVKANNTSRSIWDADTELTYTITPSLFGDDKLSGALMHDAVINTGFYDINQGTLSGGNNYHITAFTGGKIEIYYFKGDGLSKATAYEIGTAAQLAKLAEFVNASNLDFNDRYYKLTSDINLNVAPYNNIGAGWTPIGIEEQTGFGTNYIGFSGHFDGNSHRISGLYIHSSLNCAALFGVILDGVVQNLGVVNVDIIGSSYTGGVAGYVVNSSVTNCYTTGKINGSGQVGGMVGQICNSSVTNCYSTSEVNGGSMVGGIAGAVSVFSSVTNCYSTGAISSIYDVGGVAGLVSGGSSVTNCVALSPSVKFTVTRAGRVAGFLLDGGTLSNNVAWEDMVLIDGNNIKTTINNSNGTTIHGANISTTDTKLQNTYTTAYHGVPSFRLGWRFGADNNNPWKIIVGGYTLPVLYWQIAAPTVMPPHL